MSTPRNEALAAAREQALAEITPALRPPLDNAHPKWRVILTDSESLTGLAPVCNQPGSDALHEITDYPGGPKRDDDGVYDCCPWPQVDTYSEAMAAYLVGLLNADTEPDTLDAHRTEVLAEAELLPKADVVAWLVKKAREERAGSTREDRVRADVIGVLASKVARGAVRPNNLRMLPANADFFEPGRTYRREHHASPIRFLVRYIDDSPCSTYKVAFGWRVEDGDVMWSPFDSDDFTGWTDITEAGGSR